MSAFASTPSSPTLYTASTPDTHYTNTLAITPIPTAFFNPPILLALREHFESYGEINQWVPLSGFGRILVVYKSEDDAEQAKTHCDPIIVEGSGDRSQTILRVYRADPNPLITESAYPSASTAYLRPPAIEKNFLISPPGSPPIGWEPIKEDPPNVTPLADDLIAALRDLQSREYQHHESDFNGFEVLLEPQEGAGVGVYVQDCDFNVDGVEHEDAWVYGESTPTRTRWKPVATALPPMRSVMA